MMVFSGFCLTALFMVRGGSARDTIRLLVVLKVSFVAYSSMHVRIAVWLDRSMYRDSNSFD